VPDCYLGLRLDSDDTEATGVQVVAPPRFSTGRVPQPDGMVLYELVIGHPEPDRPAVSRRIFSGWSCSGRGCRLDTSVASPMWHMGGTAGEARRSPHLATMSRAWAQGEVPEAATINLPARGVHAGLPCAGMPEHGEPRLTP